MPQIIKPRTLGLLHKVERRRDGARFIIGVIAAFDLADSARLDSEQSLWTMAAETLPPGIPIDMCMPKPRAEMLIAGKINAPDATGLALEAHLAGLSTRIAVFGDRWWSVENDRYAATAPRPIGELLLSPARAFGGPGHPTNPDGLGFGALDCVGRGVAVPLPNIENPTALIHSILDQPPPAAFGPHSMMDPERQRLAGTYDAAWARDVAPALADDVHPDFFMTAPEGQRFGTYLAGDEAYRLRNFSSSAPLLEGRLPGLRPRAFVGQQDERWSEVALALDTVWFVAGARRGILVWHGVTGVDDIEGKDVTDVTLACERLGQPRPIAHYADVRRLRRDPSTATRHAFSEWQLTPPRDPAEEERRKLARIALAQERAAKHAAAMAYVTARAYDDAGVPEALRLPPPASDAPPLLLPLPTPDELESGDFDLGDALDLIEAKKAEADEKLRLLAEEAMPVLEAMKAMHTPGAGAADVDALLAAATSRTGVDVTAELDLALSQMEAPSGPGGMLLPEQIAGIGNWRDLLLEQTKGLDEDTLVEQAVARFLDLPEARPLADARAALREMSNRPAVERPEWSGGRPLPPPQKAVPRNVLAGLLDDLANTPAASSAAVTQTAEKIAAANADITKQLPGLAAAGDGSALDALLAEIGKMAPPDAGPEMDPLDDTLSGLDDRVAQVERQFDDAEVRLVEGIAAARRASPMASYPQTPMTLRMSRHFGDRVLELIRGGVSLAGRDLAGADLAGANLSGCDLSGAFLERANLARTRLCGANLTDAVLTQARLEHADFTGARLQGANLSGANAAGACFDKAQFSSTLVLRAVFSGARARRAVLTGTRFIEVDFSQADFSGARLEQVTFMRITAPHSVFARAVLRDCQFLEADLTRLNMDGVRLDHCAFVKLTAPGLSAVGSDVRGSSFLGGAGLEGADFSDGLTNEASFFGADLTGARLRRTVCDRTQFGDAWLENADFHLASLRSAMLDGAKLFNSSFVGAQMMEARLHRADLRRARFHGADLYGADLSDADLAAADFTAACLVRSVLDLETAHG